jgi:molybdenum cofactor cytidylyltransferase
MRAVAVVPAAGKAERFGSQKLVASLGGEPLLNRTIRSLLDGGAESVVVVLSPEHADRITGAVPLLADPRVCAATNPDPSRGMLSSIQTGIAAAAGDPILVLPGDMPFVRPETVAAVLAACRSSDSVVKPRHAGRRGHPIGLPARLGAVVLAADTRENLSAVLQAAGERHVEIDVSDAGILRDVDMTTDLEA